MRAHWGVGRAIREEELDVGTVESLDADNESFLLVASLDDPEVVLMLE